MPGTTPKLALRYPLPTEAPDGPGAFLQLASDVDNALMPGWAGYVPAHTGAFAFTQDCYARTVGGRTTVVFRGVWTGAAAGELQIGLVKAAAKPGLAAAIPAGRAYVTHAGNTYELGVTISADGLAIRFTYGMTPPPQVGYVTNALPFGWAAGDVLTVTFTYETT